MKRVVLFLPPYPGPPLGPPAGLLSLAAPLREAGYETKIIDAAVIPEYLYTLTEETENALCLGVSLLTGPMIRTAVEVATRVKRLRPNLPVVFGGWHPSLLPEQTLRESYIDIVVRNQGELTFLEVVRRIEGGQSLAGLAGCSYKSNGCINHNPDRPIVPLNDVRIPAYDLVDFDAYERVGGERKLPYASSVGCPYACRYCTDAVYYGSRFNALSPQRVVEEVSGLTSRYRLREVALLDSNFLVDTPRALEIARGFRDSMPGITWTFQASTHSLRRMSDEQVCTLGQSGVTCIGFGVESASTEVLARMNKSWQTIPDLFETARKCRQAGIRAIFNLIYGFPGETEANRSETFQVMGQIASRFDNVTFSSNIFTPYPGIPIWPELRELGLAEPTRLEDWTALSLGAAELPWLTGSAYRNVKRGISYFMLYDTIAHANRASSIPHLARMALQGIRKPLRWRLKRGRFGWPVELWLLKGRKWLATKRSLITGESLERGPEEICRYG